MGRLKEKNIVRGLAKFSVSATYIPTKVTHLTRNTDTRLTEI